MTTHHNDPAPRDSFDEPIIVGGNDAGGIEKVTFPMISSEDLADAWHDSKMSLRHFVPASHGAIPFGGTTGYWCDGPGVSAQTIYRHLRGPQRRDDPQFRSGSHPHDADDFGRCLELLDAVPEWNARISEMTSVSRAWKNLVKNWTTIETCFRNGERDTVTNLIKSAVAA